MNRTNTDRTKYGFWVDLNFTLRIIRLWIFAITCVSIAVGALTYVGSDLVMHDWYTASVTVAVVSKVNNTGSLNQVNTGRAVTRNLAMWNSNALLKLIKDQNPDFEVKGTLKAAAVNDSNLIKLTASAANAENAYYLLSSAIRNYHRIDSNFDANYTGIVLTRVSGDSISVSKNKPYLFAAAGFIGALAALLLSILLWTLFTDVLHDEEQAKQLLDVPLYEAIVSIDKKRFGLKAIVLTNKKLDIDYLEAIDRLTSRIEQHMHHYKQKIAMVSSIQENEGKSTMAANLALNLARRGSKTLLLDMDFRRPVIYKIFDREKQEEGSLSSLLEDLDDLAPAADHCKDLFNLDIIWQYRPIHDSDRFLERPEIQEKIIRLKDHYDYIIIDTPPMGPVRDAEVLAQIADCSLLVVREDFIRAAVVNDVTDQLEEHGAPCMGAVLNNCHSRRRVARTRYGYYYGYSNRYRKEDERQ